MLTPDKIKQKSFQTTGRGSYRAEDVDSFLNEVSASYEQMFKENGDLIKKISILAKKVEDYRADEDSLKMALLNAQKLADKIVAEAKETAEKENSEILEANAKLRETLDAEIADTKAKVQKEADTLLADANAKAEAIVADANRQANDILGNINRKVTSESLVYERIQKEASDFKGRLVAMYKEHINLINQLPEIVDEELNETEKVTEEPVVAETAVEDEVVIEETEPIVVENTDEEPEKVIEEAEETAKETVVEAITEDTAEEAVEEEPVPVKKPFKLDMSKIDFADDDDIVETPVAEAPVVEETEAPDEDETKSISFKNFFKKK